MFFHLLNVPRELGQLSNLAVLDITTNSVSIPQEVCNLQTTNGVFLPYSQIQRKIVINGKNG